MAPANDDEEDASPSSSTTTMTLARLVEFCTTKYCTHCLARTCDELLEAEQHHPKSSPNNNKIVEKLLRCSGCRSVAYCSRECQRQAWKAGHKHTCNPLKFFESEESILPIPVEHIRRHVPAELIKSSPTATEGGMIEDSFDKNFTNEDMCSDFWSHQARLHFPFLEDDRYSEQELPQGKPESILRVLEVMRLLQAQCAGACQLLKIVNLKAPRAMTAGDAANSANEVYLRYQHVLYQGGGYQPEKMPEYISWLWVAALFWTASLDLLIEQEQGDCDGERAARLRINRGKALIVASQMLPAGDVGFAGDDAREMFGFWWPIRFWDQPSTNDTRGRWDICMAMTLCASGDFRRAAKSLRASPETRAYAYLLLPADTPIRKFLKNQETQLDRALALLETTGNDRAVNNPEAEQQKQAWRKVLKEEIQKVREGDDSAVAKMWLWQQPECLHISDSDSCMMGGGLCSASVEGKFRFHRCADGNGCKRCEKLATLDKRS